MYENLERTLDVYFALASVSAGVFVLLVLVALLTRWLIRRVRKVAPAAAPEDDDGVPTFNVYALGLAETGKTMFLASMFHQLHVPMEGRPYYLKLPDLETSLLTRTLAAMVDAKQEWPRSTMIGDKRVFQFDCMVRLAETGTVEKALRINYLDYAGEILEAYTEDRRPLLESLAGQLRRDADTLLLMLDGVKVLSYMRDEPAGHSYMTARIIPLLDLVRDTTCPAYLLITKWDLVRDFGEPPDLGDNARLELVVNRLFQVEQLRAVMNQKRTLRVLPVSAVGSGFARLSDDGQVAKVPGARFSPVDVDIPFAATIPDIYELIEESLEPQLQRRINRALKQRLKSRPKRSMVSSVAWMLTHRLGTIVRATLGAALPKVISDEVILAALNYLAKPADVFLVDLQTVKDTTKRHWLALQRARSEAVKDMHRAVMRFEARLPASRPSGRSR